VQVFTVPDAPEPPRKTYALKPKEFERVNPLVEAGAAPPAENDVYAIRRQLREREVAAGMDALAPAPRKKSRRKRDYWLSIALINLAMIGITVASGFNIVVMCYTGAGMIVATLGLTWTMWFVMDDY
jgi:hypothetical protein